MERLKTLFYILLPLLFAISSIQAQETDSKPVTYQQELEKAMEKLSAEQQKEVLFKAIQLADLNTKAEVERFSKTLSLKDKMDLLKFAETVKDPATQKKSHTHDVSITTKDETIAKTEEKAESKAEEKKLENTLLKFDEKQHNFGTINQGEIYNYTYAFTNTGKHPLLITKAKGTCGCTIPTWPKEPIPPGEKGEVKVEYNSKNKQGSQFKIITVYGNIPGGSTSVTLRGTVAVPDKE